MSNKSAMQKKVSNTKKTALYTRVSTEDQYEHGYSLEAQEEKLKHYCEMKGITNYEVYSDGGWSGSNLDRPDMQRLIAGITSKEISSVVVYKLDRLSRSQRDTMFMLEDIFIAYDCDFISINENFDTSTPYGKAMIGILSVFAQLERENIRERTRMGMYSRVKAGFWMGGGRVPFGYDYDPEKDILVPNEHADEVKRIFELYLEGHSSVELSKIFPSVAGDSHIRHILSRPTYCGKIKFRDEYFEGLHQPIISEELFEKVQVELKKRSNKHIARSEYLLAGFVYCGKCGAKMRYQKWGQNRVLLYCYSQQKSKPNLIKDPDCNNKKVESSDLEKLVIADLFKRTKEVSRENSKLPITISTLSTLQTQYDILSKKLKRLYNLYAESNDDLLLETITENRQSLTSLSQQIENEKKAKALTSELSEKQKTILELESRWDTLTIDEKRHALRICINKIIVTDDEINIVYNF